MNIKEKLEAIIKASGSMILCGKHPTECGEWHGVCPEAVKVIAMEFACEVLRSLDIPDLDHRKNDSGHETIVTNERNLTNGAWRITRDALVEQLRSV
jgi:hypothetical protein